MREVISLVSEYNPEVLLQSYSIVKKDTELISVKTTICNADTEEVEHNHTGVSISLDEVLYYRLSGMYKVVGTGSYLNFMFSDGKIFIAIILN